MFLSVTQEFRNVANQQFHYPVELQNTYNSDISKCWKTLWATQLQYELIYYRDESERLNLRHEMFSSGKCIF